MGRLKVATPKKKLLRMGLGGPSGAGKTWTAFEIANCFGKVAGIDADNGGMIKYAGVFPEFLAIEYETDLSKDPEPYKPSQLIADIKEIEDSGADILIIDSMSNFWNGPGGILSIVEREKQRSRSKNGFSAWANATKELNKLMDKILHCKLHVICCFRSKMAYSQEKDDKGKTVIQKLGMQPIFKDDVEYEFDLFLDMDQGHSATVSCSRIHPQIPDYIETPGKDLAQKIYEWTQSGEDPEVVRQREEERARAKGRESLESLAESKGITAQQYLDAHRDGSKLEELNLQELREVYGKLKAYQPPTPEPEEETESLKQKIREGEAA